MEASLSTKRQYDISQSSAWREPVDLKTSERAREAAPWPNPTIQTCLSPAATSKHSSLQTRDKNLTTVTDSRLYKSEVIVLTTNYLQLLLFIDSSLEKSHLQASNNFRQARQWRLCAKWNLPCSHLTGGTSVSVNLFSHYNWHKHIRVMQNDTVVKCMCSNAYEVDEGLTSYFCLLSVSLRSNFSASSSIIHCHNSLAFSLRNQVTHSDIRRFQNLI